ncbi:MAG: class I SAM-dependent methyltransferase [FCB group bacterium]|nr:class I SAM-dependent methyltransferase [FCB group bacterium]
MTQFRIEKMRDHWDGKSADYSRDRVLSEVDKYLLSQIKLSPGQRILEIGAGSGIIGRELIRQNSGVIYYNLDLSLKFIRIARENQGAEAIAVMGDAAKLPFRPESFDAVLEMDAIHHFPRHLLHQPVSEIGRVLKPGGIVYMAEDWGKKPVDEKEKLAYSLQNRRMLPSRGLEYHPSDDEWEKLFGSAGMIEILREHIARPLNLEYFRSIELPEAESEYNRLIEFWGDAQPVTLMTIHIFEKQA